MNAQKTNEVHIFPAAFLTKWLNTAGLEIQLEMKAFSKAPEEETNFQELSSNWWITLLRVIYTN